MSMLCLLKGLVAYDKEKKQRKNYKGLKQLLVGEAMVIDIKRKLKECQPKLRISAEKCKKKSL